MIYIKNGNSLNLNEVEINNNVTYNLNVNENGTYIFIVKGVNGNTYEKKIDITNIDKLEPKTFTPVVETTVDKIIITAQTEDEEATETDGKSGIKGYRVSKDNGQTYTNWQENGEFIIQDIEDSPIHNIVIQVQDNAGNIRTETVEVANKYIVTYDYRYATRGNSEKNKVVTYGQPYGELPNPKRTHVVRYEANGGNIEIDRQTAIYSFGGWYKDIEFIKSVSESTIVNATSNHTLYAKWTNGTITLPSGTKEGHELEGWYTDKTLKNKIGNPGEEYNPNTDITLYANWKVIPSVTLNADIRNWTNGNVKVTATTSETKYTIQTSVNGKDWGTTNPITFTANGTMYARLTDGTNTGAISSYTVTNIDKEKPKLNTLNISVIKPIEVVNPNCRASQEYNLVVGGNILTSGIITGQQFYLSNVQASDNVGIANISYSVVCSPINIGNGTISNARSGTMTVGDSLAGKNATLTLTIKDMAGNIITHTQSIYIYTKIEKGVYLMYANVLDRLPEYEGFKTHCDNANIIMSGRTTSHITSVLNTMTFTPTGTEMQQRAQKLGYYLFTQFFDSQEFIERVNNWNIEYNTTKDLAQSRVIRRVYYTYCQRVPKEPDEILSWVNMLGNMEVIISNGRYEYSSSTKEKLINVANSFLNASEVRNKLNELYAQ